ncbi:MAG: IPT/TIG domain-containing protein [Patescibacteria group bacterium]
MRNTLAHALLALFVVTLAASNMLLADKFVDAQSQIPALAGRLAVLETTHLPIPSPTSTPLPIPTNAPLIESLTPAIGRAGTTVTVKGIDFLPTGNEVIIGTTWVGSFISRDGNTIRFTVPQRMVTCMGEGDREICKITSTSTFVGKSPLVWIRNAYGQSNRVPFFIKK